MTRIQIALIVAGLAAYLNFVSFNYVFMDLMKGVNINIG
jgi:hypothetical protein